MRTSTARYLLPARTSNSTAEAGPWTDRKRLPRALRPLGVLALLCTSSWSTIAHGQWQTNPPISSAEPKSALRPFIMVPINGGVAQIDSDFKAHTLDSHGDSAGEQSLWWHFSDDPNSPYPKVSGLVGCALGDNQFALACSVELSSSSGQRIEVAQFHYLDNSGYVSYQLDNVVTVGIGTKISVAPNIVDSSGTIDGVLVAWRRNGTTPPDPHTGFYTLYNQVLQQGVRGDGTLIWDGESAAEGALVSNSGDAANPLINDPPTVTSDGNGLAIVTYRVLSDGVDIITDPDAYRFHWTTKLDADGEEKLFDCPVPGQVGNSQGECLVARDGSGGAFYCFANDTVNGANSETDLFRARVSGDGSTQEGHVFWPTVATHQISPKMRPLAVVATRLNSVVLVYRDMVAIHTITFGDQPGLPILWTTWVQGATAENSDEAAAVLGPDYVGIAWVSGSVVAATGLAESNGAAMWVDQPQVTVNNLSELTSMDYTPQEPRIVPTAIACGSYSAGFIVGWHEPNLNDGYYFAERLDDGGYTAPPCMGKWEKYGLGLAGAAGIEPTLAGTGYPMPGAVLTLNVDHAATYSPCVLLIGFSPASLPALGGHVNVAPPFLTATLLIGATGEMAMPLMLPNNAALTGLNVFMQGIVLDPAAIHGAAFTKGLRLEIG